MAAQEEESKENEFDGSVPLHCPTPPRTPFTSLLDQPQFESRRLKDEFTDKFPIQYNPKKSDRKLSISAQSSPAKSITRPTSITRSSQSTTKPRLYRTIPMPVSEISAQLPHFELDEDPLFWADHNVQVLIRIRPLSATERDSDGCGRCLRQDSAHSLTWLGHPETRFTFDHVACETISQETLFRAVGLPMVENCMSGYNSCLFAYGQTGSGKTYTMMGEIKHEQGKLSEECGITLRVFEYLLSRIQTEEENKKDEKLKFSCKCSFLEIYNEQITDLLDPSSTNLQLREDLNKGVYVDNLTEYHVKSVNDVTTLLLRGAANRKMAVTYMNSESSRSHSVFTCIIESWWEKDSMTHCRFARLNLVDLAGSERQKSSGAEGDRLKEAANINKSLSTLGLVIMSLVDLAHGKHRHVPYRDSRLTFLLQDSLGGNSKTAIIATVSPSLCSSHETLSTFKFAQRAKLIQNNAKVNEEASGDVGALQRQIQKLKDQLSFYVNHKNSQSLTSSLPNIEKSRRATISCSAPGLEFEKVKSMEAILFGALRRERVAETVIVKLEAEIMHLNRIAHERREDVHCTKKMLQLQDEKIQNLEAMVDGSLPAYLYLMEENKALKDEIQQLQARINLHKESTLSSSENTRVAEQIQEFQHFYEQGERETSLAESSELHSQLLEKLTRKPDLPSICENQVQMNVIGTENDMVLEINFGKSQINSKITNENKSEAESVAKPAILCSEHQENETGALTSEGNVDIEYIALQARLNNLAKDLEESKLLNCHYQVDQAARLSQQHELEIVREQVEIETAETILHLHGEVVALQLELNERHHSLKEENARLSNIIKIKEEETRTLCAEWERAILELTNYLVDGSKSIKDASTQIEIIASSFPCLNVWVSENVEKAAKACIEKEETILHLERSLQDAQKMALEMELKLDSLKEATFAFNKLQQINNDEETESKTYYTEDQANGNKKCDSASSVARWLSDCEKITAIDDILESGGISNMDSPCRLTHSFETSSDIVTSERPNTKKVISNNNFDHATAFFRKCQEAGETMKEADYMLHELLKANENAKQLNGSWKQPSEEITEENEKLKSSTHLILEGETILVELANSISQLEECFFQMQREVENNYKDFYAGLLSKGREMLSLICKSRLSLEDICSYVMEQGSSLYIMHQCMVGKIVHRIQSSNLFSQQEDMVINEEGQEEGKDEKCIGSLKIQPCISPDDVITENLALKKELERKEVLLKGLLFDFSLLQEISSNKKDIKDQAEKLLFSLSEVRRELELKTSQLDDLLDEHRKVQGHLAETEHALFEANSNLEEAEETTGTLSDQNAELRMLLKDLYIEKSEVVEQLEAQKEVVTGLEQEIIHLTGSPENQTHSSIEKLKEDLRKVTDERDQLQEEICSLNDKVAMAYALADENEAIAAEACQESEASKIQAAQKEDEAKILEHSIEELERTINMLEKKVHEMDEEVERHQLIRDSLEQELHSLRQRLSLVESFSDSATSDCTNSLPSEDLYSRQLERSLLELKGAKNKIRILETEISEKDKEIKQCKDHISELVLHSEAQAVHYQEKFKTLEAMVREVTANVSNSVPLASNLEKSEKSSVRSRGLSSPFRCIGNLVQQMNVANDHELSEARLRIEELESTLASQQKEVCGLNARLAAADNMTHDVIRDLLGVKLDMTSYADLIDQFQVQKLVEDAHNQTEEFLAKEQEIINLKKRIDDLNEENESCITEANRKVADILAAQMAVEQLQEREQLLSAQNEILKRDKSNLLRRVAELDEMVKTLLGTQSTQRRIQRPSETKDKSVLRPCDAELNTRLMQSKKLLHRVNDELAQYCKSSSTTGPPRTRVPGNSSHLKRK